MFSLRSPGPRSNRARQCKDGLYGIKNTWDVRGPPTSAADQAKSAAAKSAANAKADANNAVCPLPGRKWFMHRVGSRDTLLSISIQYDCTIEVIKLHNSGLAFTKPSEVLFTPELRVPVPKTAEDAEIEDAGYSGSSADLNVAYSTGSMLSPDGKDAFDTGSTQTLGSAADELFADLDRPALATGDKAAGDKAAADDKPTVKSFFASFDNKFKNLKTISDERPPTATPPTVRKTSDFDVHLTATTPEGKERAQDAALDALERALLMSSSDDDARSISSNSTHASPAERTDGENNLLDADVDLFEL